MSFFFLQFLANHTACSISMILFLSLHLSVMQCVVAKRYILQQKCLNKWIGSAPRNIILQLSTPSTLTYGAPQTTYLLNHRHWCKWCHLTN